MTYFKSSYKMYNSQWRGSDERADRALLGCQNGTTGAVDYFIFIGPYSLSDNILFAYTNTFSVTPKKYKRRG